MLERHALGELDAAGAERVSRHLDGCAACRAAMAAIDGDRDRALPPFPDLALARAARRRRALVAGTAMAVAAAAALLLFWRDRGERPMTAGVRGGDEIGLSLVRERAGDIAHDPGGFRAGDRFKVLVTCAAPGPVTVEVTVRQDGAVDRPLPPAAIHCGNRVALPGAFRVVGRAAATICVAAGAASDCRELQAE
jgi:hypothetical protein